MMKTAIYLVAAMALLLVLPAAADGGSSDGPNPVPSKITRLIESEQYDRAIKELTYFLRRERKSADGWNWLGYSQRSVGDFEGALKSYTKALKIDRQHLGANEYLGELYVMQGDMDSAREQLVKLEDYCGDCDEYRKLAEVIANSQ